MIRITHQEFLPNNTIDEQMQAFLQPLELSHAFFIQSKFTIRKNFITPNTNLYGIISFIGTILITGIYLFHIAEFLNNDFNNTLNTISAIINISIVIMFICIDIANLSNAETNVKLILHLQEARNKVKFCNFDIKDLIVGNRIILWFNIIISMVYIIVISYYAPSLTVPIAELMVVMFDMAQIYSIRIIILIRRTVEVWFDEIKLRNEIGFNNEADIEWKEVQDAFYNISKAYKIHQRVFCVPVSPIFEFHV